MGTGQKQKPVTASAELSGDPPRWRSLSGCLLEYDAVGAGSPLFVSMTARLDRNNSPQSVRRARALADEERHMHRCEASPRHEARALSYLRAAVSVASRDLALSVCFPLACDRDVASYISIGNVDGSPLTKSA